MHMLTFRQKQQLSKASQSRTREAKNATQVALAVWANVAFDLDCVLNLSRIGHIVKSDPLLSQLHLPVPIHSKRSQEAAAFRWNKSLYKWLCDVNFDGVLLNNEIVKIIDQNQTGQANLPLRDENKL